MLSRENIKVHCIILQTELQVGEIAINSTIRTRFNVVSVLVFTFQASDFQLDILNPGRV